MTIDIVLTDEVRRAVEAGGPSVALETSVLAQGLPYPRNVEADRTMSEAIRSRGAAPAWIFIAGGRIHVGATADELDALTVDASVVKVARRDLPVAVAAGMLGATTVSAMLWAAARAGIEVSATGGIGGVHQGTNDVSADLSELARTPGTLVCAGPKSIVDPAATLERLEELGVLVVAYRCDRLPFFVVGETDLPVEHRADEPEEVAAAALARRDLGVASTLLVCNPIDPAHAIPAELMRGALKECTAEARRRGITGKLVTPFLLTCIAERTGGASLEANLVLLEANAGLAADIAVALSASPSPAP